MIKMFKIGIATLLTLVTFMFPAVAFAESVTSKACIEIPDSVACKSAQAGQSENPLFGPRGILTRAIDIISMVAGVIAVIVLIIAGIRFITSQANPQTVSTARNQIIYALVGLVVVGLAQALVTFVLSKL